MIDCTSQRCFLKKIDFLILTVLISTFLHGCSSQSDAAWKTMQLGFRDEASQIEKSPLKPNLNYLRANINGLDVLLVKGYVDSSTNGPIDVWYSSDGSVMRTQAGRYLGSIGFDQNWQEVTRNEATNFVMLLNNELNTMKNPLGSTSLLPIKSVKKYFSTQSYVAKPSYLVMRDERVSAVISGTPPESVPNSFKKYLRNQDLIWVSETPQPNDLFKKKGSSFAWYGFVKNNGSFTQVISQQCLSKEFCITWMPWPIQP